MEEYKRKKVRKSSAKKPRKAKNSDNIFFDDNEEVKVRKTKSKKKTVIKKEKLKKSENTEYQEPATYTDENDIESNKTSRRAFKVLKSNEKKGKKTFLRYSAAILVLAGLIVLASYLMPGGILEYIGGCFSSFGGGDYPIEYNGSLIYDEQSIGSCYFLLNDTTLTVYNKGGKELYKYQHGFSNPVLNVSSSRAILFNEGGDTAYVFNKSGLKKTVKTENTITNAAIGRNGHFAISCAGGEYTSTVFVYNKNGKKIYTWNSAKDIVNTLAISPRGKKIAVSCLNVNNAVASDKLYVLEYKSADPVFTHDFGSDIILDIRSTLYGFSCVSENNYSYFSWTGFKKKSFSVDNKNLSLLRKQGDKTLLVFNRHNDKSDNRIVLMSAMGNIKGEFDFNGIITDIQIRNGRIYILSDTKIFVYNRKGSLLSEGVCDWGVKRFYVLSSGRIALISDDKISKLTV